MKSSILIKTAFIILEIEHENNCFTSIPTVIDFMRYAFLTKGKILIIEPTVKYLRNNNFSNHKEETDNSCID